MQLAHLSDLHGLVGKMAISTFDENSEKSVGCNRQFIFK